MGPNWVFTCRKGICDTYLGLVTLIRPDDLLDQSRVPALKFVALLGYGRGCMDGICRSQSIDARQIRRVKG